MEFGPAAWIVLFAIGLALEFTVIAGRKVRWTLSYQVWFLRAKFWGRLFLVPAWSWLTWHFFLEPQTLGPGAGNWVDDYIVIAIGVVLALLRDFKDPMKPPEAERHKVDGV